MSDKTFSQNQLRDSARRMHERTVARMEARMTANEETQAGDYIYNGDKIRLWKNAQGQVVRAARVSGGNAIEYLEIVPGEHEPIVRLGNVDYATITAIARHPTIGNALGLRS